MTDLFNHDTHPEEAALGEAMARHHQEHDLPIIRERGVIPDWMGEPRPLSKDKARLLSHLYEHGYIAWTPSPSKNNRNVTNAIGLQSAANAQAVIDMCLRDELIETREYRGDVVYQMSMSGEFALDDYELDKELGIL